MTKNSRLKFAREKSGLNQQELAEKLPVNRSGNPINQSYIAQIETKKGYSFKQAKELAKALNVTAEWLYYGDNNSYNEIVTNNKQHYHNQEANINQKAIYTDSKKIINKRLEVKNEGITLDTPIPKPKTMLILEEESPDLGDLKIILPPQKAIPIYNTEFYQITEDNKIEYLPTQNWTSNSIYLGCDAIIRNNGEGMAPIIGDGYLMGIKRVDKDLYFSQGSIYTLITLSGFKLTKYVWKGIREDSFRIHGANDTHPEEEISKNEILSMWHVRVSTPSGLPKMFD